MKNSRTTAKKFSRRFSRKHAPQSEHFRSVNFGEADLSEKESSVVFGGQARTKILWATIVENCRPIYPKIYGLRKLYRYLSALTCLPIVVIRWGAFYERVI
ncbi:DUF1661 domain-containing protein [Porphyromonas gingivalis]|uniref:DUF1661 domain-containing protein n=1 Tax=Porphyromonas gingivalis TaxID=837 RepID=UPI001E59CC71|nr:DUF1661 domain-containing protein [Porphyromonas gingivalis]